MFALISIIVLGVIALIAIGAGVIGKSLISAGVGILALLIGGGVLFASTFYTNGVGEAKVIINLDGTVAGTVIQPGTGWKAPTQEFVDFDLFSQEVQYVGKPGEPAVYTGGTVNGAEVTTSVANGAQANVDITVTYSLDADKVEAIYKKYKSQERFTKQVVEKTILTSVREIPSKYTAVEFRGEKKGEAGSQIFDLIESKLKPLGVTIDFVNLQDVRYSAEVEVALREVEVATQNVQKQEAELRAAEVKAQQLVAVATAEAEANNLVAKSLTPQILQKMYLEALKAGTVYVVPSGSTPFITAK